MNRRLFFTKLASGLVVASAPTIFIPKLIKPVWKLHSTVAGRLSGGMNIQNISKFETLPNYIADTEIRYIYYPQFTEFWKKVFRIHMKEYEVYEITTHHLIHNKGRIFLVGEVIDDSLNSIPVLSYEGSYRAKNEFDATDKAINRNIK